MNQPMLLFEDQGIKMTGRKMLLMKAWSNCCLNRGDRDELTGEWSQLLKLEDGRTNYDNEMLAFTDLVISGKVKDEVCELLLRGASIKSDSSGKMLDIQISSESLESFDGIEVHSKVTLELMRLMRIYFPDFMRGI